MNRLERNELVKFWRKILKAPKDESDKNIMWVARKVLEDTENEDNVCPCCGEELKDE